MKFGRKTAAVLLLLTMGIFSACSPAGGNADTGGEAAVTEDVSVTGMDLSGYTLVIPWKSNDAESDLMMQLYKNAKTSSLKMSNDNFAETEKEILLGATSRAQSAEIMANLQKLKTEKTFHYTIAMVDGKAVMAANDVLGYTYLKERLADDFIRNGKLYLPADIHETVEITMDEYYASEFYAAVLKAQEDRVERENFIAAEEARLREESLTKLKTMNDAFTAEQFGKITSFANSPYGKPEIYPDEGQHPRILFTDSRLEKIRAGAEAEENAAAYKKYLVQSEYHIGYGKLPEPQQAGGHNYDKEILGAIEAKAFRYALTGDEYFGYEAVVGIKNYILTLTIPDGSMNDPRYNFGYVMFAMACVYDWCYDLLDADDKTQLMAGCMNFLANDLEIGFPPNKQGAIVGHGCGGQLLKNWLSVAIAAADEFPDVYEYVAGRIFDEYVPGQNYFLASGTNHQGNNYGLGRYESVLDAHILFRYMSDKGYEVFDGDGIERTVTTGIHYIRPDGQGIRIGDDYTEYADSYTMSAVWQLAIRTAGVFGNEIHKGFVEEYTNGFNANFAANNSGISATLFLIFNDTSLKSVDPDTLNLVNYNGSPTGAMIARSAWDDPNAPMVYMKVGESYTSNHEHLDAGTFQIFYKGILASDSGSYYLYGTDHDYAYYKQTIAHNSLLIYNPAADRHDAKWIYSGGQALRDLGEKKTLQAFLASSKSKTGEVTGHDYEATDKELTFAYLAGDITSAYDAETVDEVSRSMIAMMTDDEKCPMVFVTYDRITADDPSFKKTFLLHVQEEPTVTEDGFAIVTNTRRGSSGKMIVQSCLTDTEYTVIGGEGKEFMVNGTNIPNTLHPRQSENSLEEFGWGRIEISPAAQAKTDRLLTVMYVTDAANTDAPRKAAEIETDTLVGAVLFNRAALFVKDPGKLNAAAAFTVSADGDVEYYISGVAAGKWNVTVNGKSVAEVSVTEDSGLLRFTAPAGAVTVTPIR